MAIGKSYPFMRSLRSRTAIIFANLLLGIVMIAFAGCESNSRQLREAEEAVARPYQSESFSQTNGLFHVRRVVVMPLFTARELDPETKHRLDEIWSTAFQRANAFETVPLSRDELESISGARQWDSTRQLPADLLREAARRSGADAVVFCDLTVWQPYKPMVIGLRAKIADNATGRVLWVFDDVFDAGNQNVFAAAAAYQRELARPDFPLGTGSNLAHSPSRFFQYCAWAAVRTIRADQL